MVWCGVGGGGWLGAGGVAGVAGSWWSEITPGGPPSGCIRPALFSPPPACVCLHLLACFTAPVSSSLMGIHSLFSRCCNWTLDPPPSLPGTAPGPTPSSPRWAPGPPTAHPGCAPGHPPRFSEGRNRSASSSSTLSRLRQEEQPATGANLGWIAELEERMGHVEAIGEGVSHISWHA